MSDLEPNDDGLFAFAAIAALAEKRGCEAIAVSDKTCKIRGALTTVDLVFQQQGGCSARQIFAACTAASGRRQIPQERIKPPAGLDTQSHDLLEFRIAELLAADGILPYRAGRRTVAFESLVRVDAADGAIRFAGESRCVKAAVRCVVDARLADVEAGPRGGWERARLSWRSRAKPPLPDEVLANL
jgi:hypothetical protein